MTDTGLQQAIRAVGGVTELARRIGIAQPSVSNWTRVPAERVIVVEEATGIDRSILRPDLYAVYNPMPDRAACEMEVELGIALREKGYGVWQA